MAQVKILAFSGSGRKGSFNQKLVQVAAQGARESGATVEVLNLGEYGLPIFDEDLERDQGIPQAVHDLKKLFIESHGLLIASPEYNSSLTALLKNTIDWITRPVEGETPLQAFDGKVAGLMATSPGSLGGLRGLVHLRAILQNIQVTVIPDQLMIPQAHEAFDESGNLKDGTQQAAIKGIGAKVASVAGKLN